MRVRIFPVGNYLETELEMIFQPIIVGAIYRPDDWVGGFRDESEARPVENADTCH